MSIADFLAEVDAEDRQRRQPSGPSSNVAGGGGAAGGGLSDPATIPGEGASQSLPPGVADTQATPPPPPPPPPPVTWGRRLAGIVGGALRAPFTAGASYADLQTDALQATPTTFTALPELGIPAVFAAYAFGGHAAQFERGSALAKIGEPGWNETAAQVLSLAVGGVGVEAGLGREVRAAAQGLENGALRFGATAAQSAGEAGIVQGGLMDPEQERFSNYLGMLGLHTSFTDYLSHTDEETHAEGRFKNAVEGVVTGAAADQLFRVGRYWYKALKGDTKAADAIAEEIGGEAPKDTPESKIEEVPASEAGASSAAETKPPADTTLVAEQGADGTLNLRAVPKEATGEVQAEAPKGEGAPEAPAGDAPSSPDQPPDAILFRLTGGAEGEQPRVIGSTTPQDLKALGEDISIWRAVTEVAGREANDITSDIAPDAAERVGNFHISPLGTPDNVAPLLRAFMDRLPATAVRSDTDLMKAARAVANDVGEDPNALVEAGRMIAGKLTDADVAMATLRSIWVRAAKDIDELNLPGVEWASLSDEEFSKAAQAVHNMTTLSTYIQNAKQALGRGLRVNQLPDADTYLGSLAKAGEEVSALPPRAMSPLPRSREELKDWMELWSMTKGDPARRAKLLADLLTVPKAGMYLRSSVANLFTANILSAPRTILLNVIGPAFINTVHAVERLSGAAANALNPLLSAEERASARAVARATVPAYFQVITDIGGAMRQAWRAGEINHSIIGGGGSFDALSAFGPLTDNLLNAAGSAPDWRYTLGNYINVWPSAMARLNNGLDEFSKRLAYQGEVRVRAMVEASEKGLTGDDAHALIGERLAGAYDEAGGAADEQLLRAAEKVTFTAQVGEKGTWARRFGDGLQQLRRDIPEVRFLIPVFNVAANAMGETLRRLPIAYTPGFNRLFPLTMRELGGELGPVAQAEARGRMMTGAAFLTAGVMLNRAGLLTGAGPQDPTDRKVWLATHQPYSIRMGDTWVRYDRFDILGGLLSIPATISDATTHRPADKGVEDLMWSGVGALAQWFRDRSSLQNAASLLGTGVDPTQDAGAFASKFIGKVSAGLLVPNLIQTTITDTVDPVARMKQSWTDYLREAIPGLSATLEPVRNVLGEPVNRSSDTFAEAVFPVLMSPASSFARDSQMDELDRLYQATGYGAGADPHNIGFGFFNPKAVALEDGRSIYDHFMQARQVMKVNGYTLREALGNLFDSSEYANAVDADPFQRTTSLGDTSRGYLVKQTFEAYNDAIRAELASGSHRANAYLVAAAAKQRDDAYLKDVSADSLVANPDLYRARGINAEAYSNKLTAGSTGALASALGVQPQ